MAVRCLDLRRWLVVTVALGMPLVTAAPPGGVPYDGGEEFTAKDQSTTAGFDKDLMARIQNRLEAKRPAGTASATLNPSQWAAAIDATWGPGLPTARKLEIFDTFWTTIDEHYPSFAAITVDWSALRARYRPEVAGGVSRGRFAAIMNYLSLALRDPHVKPLDLPVAYGTPLVPGVPMAGVGQWGANNSGTCGTAQADGSTLLYDVSPGNPLGLQRGDRILGFDGRPWTDLYPELLAAELPLSPVDWGGSPAAFDDTFIAAANINWHLYATIDVAKHDTGQIRHLPTAPLRQAPHSAYCTEQMDIPGVAKPDALSTTPVSWGVIPGTRIGYIYVWHWFYPEIGPVFARAIRELTQDQHTDGLIIDNRFDLGGYLRLDDEGLGMLFQGQTATIGMDIRADPADHLKMRRGTPPSFFVIDREDQKQDKRSYDHPIAVLTGPGAVSQGDHFALRLTLHPRTRTFGKPTAAGFGPVRLLDLDPDWDALYPFLDAYRVGQPHHYLTHDDVPVDEPIWLNPDDVAAGRDTVVDAAIHWINAQTP
jgi:hypothetical protein